MIRIKTKIQLHIEIQNQTVEFLRSGGKINHIAGGASSVDPLTGNRNPYLPTKKTAHSYLTKEVLAVETRRAEIKHPKLLKVTRRNLH